MAERKEKKRIIIRVKGRSTLKEGDEKREEERKKTQLKESLVLDRAGEDKSRLSS
jgi:hypothetical protein